MKKGLIFLILGLCLFLSLGSLKEAKARTYNYDFATLYPYENLDSGNNYPSISTLNTYFTDPANTFYTINTPYAMEFYIDNELKYYYFDTFYINKEETDWYLITFGGQNMSPLGIQYTIHSNGCIVSSTYQSQHIYFSLDFINSFLGTFIISEFGLDESQVNCLEVPIDIDVFVDFNYEDYIALQGSYDFIYNRYTNLQNDYNDLNTLYQSTQEMVSTNFFHNVFQGFGNLLGVEIFPNFTLGTLLIIPLMFVVLIVILRLAI